MVIFWGPYGILTILLSMFPLEIKSIKLIQKVVVRGTDVID